LIPPEDMDETYRKNQKAKSPERKGKAPGKFAKILKNGTKHDTRRE